MMAALGTAWRLCQTGRRPGPRHPRGAQGGQKPRERKGLLTPDELESIWVLLLRHEAAPRGVCVAALDEGKLLRRVDDEVLCPAAEVHQVKRSEEEGLRNKVAVRDGVHAVGADSALEAELAGKELAVDAKGVAGEGAASQGKGADAGQEVRQPLVVALPGGGVAQDPVAPADGHGGLEVGEAGHQHVGLALGALRGNSNQLVEAPSDHLQLIVEPQPSIRRHLRGSPEDLYSHSTRDGSQGGNRG